MPQIHYPFIDIAVHPAIRTRFAAGEAIVLLSRDMDQVLWANGEGAKLFGYSEIYELLDNGPAQAGVAFRQLAATGRQLQTIGDRRSLMMRINTGFSSQAIAAEVSLVEIRSGEIVVIFSAPVAANSSASARIAAMLKGFDDPDTHMAIIDDEAKVLAASPAFHTLGITPDAARAMIGAAARTADGLIKRPIASSAGYLPAAIGRLSIDPPLNLLFCVETVLGRMDPPTEPASAPMIDATAAVSGDDTDVTQVPEVGLEDTQPPVSAEEPLVETQTASEPTAPEELDPSVSTVDEPEQPFAAIDEVSNETTPDAEDTHLDAPTEIEAVHADIPDSTLPMEAAADENQIAEAEDFETQDSPATDASDIALGDTEQTEDELTEAQESEDLADLGLLDGASQSDLAGHDSPDDSAEPETDTAEEQPAELEDATGNDPVPRKAELTAEPAQEQPFVFRADGRPVRFVWKLDAHGMFSEVSDEFARTVGPHAGAINGMAYRDLDRLFHLDPGGEIAALLERRDTWSGRTIRWPVEGTDLIVPIDLAALPTYSRNREFDGFRGFGIIRLADAERDPHAVGMMLTGKPDMALLADTAREPASTPAQTQLPADDGDDVPLTVDDQFRNMHQEDLPPVSFSEPQVITDGEARGQDEDAFRGEVPALRTDPLSPGIFSEKIIQLEERRARGRDGLTTTEQNAFREIARQLEPFGKRPNETLFDQPKQPVEAEQDIAQIPAEAPDAEASLAELGEPTPQVAEDAEAPHLHDDAPIDATTDAQAAPAMDADEEEQQDEIRADDPGLTASAADQIPLPILIHAGDRLIYANNEFIRFSGYTSLEALEAAGGLDILIARREGPEAGVYATRADGSQLAVSARLQSVRYEGAKLLMLTMTPADPAPAQPPEDFAEDQQTARKLSALKVEADELRSILETATDGVVVLDTEGRIRSMNRSANALFNFEDSETRGKPFAMLFAHESQKAVQDYLNGLAGHGVASVLNDGREVIGREASGGFLPLFMTMGRMPGSNSYCAVMRDITQWKRSEEELKAAKRAAETANQHKSDFLARVSHEIRTPLNAIIGFSDMIASEHFGPAGHSRYVEYANDIGRSGRHVLDIVNDLLDISKIEAGEMDLEFAAVGINDCVSEAVSLVQPQANTQRVIIRTSLSQSVPDVVADLRSIKQIAINILANAIRFTPSGGQIVVSSAYEPNGAVTLRIRDTGIGMSKNELDQAMKPFGQVHPGTRQRGDGTGLGLPLTRAMTEANRAVFSIQSAPNEGTLVEITFPPQRVLAD
jgi:PAS domain S-box-containing protein